MNPTSRKAVLEVRDLSVAFGPAKVVDRISFSVAPGETLGLVGESGCGKSTTALALMGLLPNATIGGDACLAGQSLTSVDEATRRRIRGSKIAMIFQDPGTALHPMIRIGAQLTEAVRAHLPLSRREARDRAAELLRQVGIAAPEARLQAFPHELSGGMCQRVMIAMAIACRPQFLLADEPTTALDVTIQAQILELLQHVAAEGGMGMILITHDLGVVAGSTERVAVMYAGEIVETAPTESLFSRPLHPYTQGLMKSIPAPDGGFDEPIPVIPGDVASAAQAKGCRFSPRCPMASSQCEKPQSLLPAGEDHHVACWRAL